MGMEGVHHLFQRQHVKFVVNWLTENEVNLELRRRNIDLVEAYKSSHNLDRQHAFFVSPERALTGHKI